MICRLGHTKGSKWKKNIATYFFFTYVRNFYEKPWYLIRERPNVKCKWDFIDCLIYYIVFYDLSAICWPYNGGKWDFNKKIMKCVVAYEFIFQWKSVWIKTIKKIRFSRWCAQYHSKHVIGDDFITK